MILNMPGKKPEDLKGVLRYLNLLEEQLRYVLANIDGGDITAGTINTDQLALGAVSSDRLADNVGDTIDISRNESISFTIKKLNEQDGKTAQLVITIDGISTKVADAEGNIATLQQTAKGLESRVKLTEDGVAQLRTDSEGMVERLISAETSITQTAEKVEQKAEKTSVDALTGRVASAEASITTQAGEISLKASKKDVTDAVDDIEIGGRNLLLNSGQEVTNNLYTVATYKPVTPLVPGETYTFSLCLTPGSGMTYIAPYVSNGNYSFTSFYPKGTSKQVLSQTFVMGDYYPGRTPEDDISNARVHMVRFPNDGTTGNTTIHWVKIEKGNKATDWTPAPEDLETRVLNAETAITLTNEEIKLKASKTEVDNLTGRVKDTEAQIAVQAGEISLKASKTEVNNISVGGTNILPGYADEKSTDRYIGIPCREILEPHIGKDICISFECKASIARALTLYGYQSRGVSFQGTFSFIPSTTEFTRHSFVTKVYKWPDEEGYTTGAISIYDYVGSNNYTIRKFKIELGNKPTDWSPCPDDPVKTLKNTAMTLTADGIAMTTTGHFRLYANDGKNSRIKLGGDNATANFSVDETGALGAVSGDFANGLTVGNQPVWTRANIIISGSQPTNVHDVLWIKPLQGVEQVQHGFLNTSQGYWVHDESYTYSLAPKSSDALTPGGSYQYTLTLQMAKGGSGKGIKSYTMQATLSTSAGSVTLTSPAFTLNDWGNAQVTLTATSATNLFAASGNVNASISVKAPETGNTYLYVKNNTEIALTSKNTSASSAGAQTCSIHYIN